MLIEDQDILEDLMLDKEILKRWYPMMEWLERIKPIKLVEDEVKQITYYKDLTEDDEMFTETKLFRLVDKEEMISYDDQTTRSILKDLRKRIKHYENRLTVSNRIKETNN